MSIPKDVLITIQSDMRAVAVLIHNGCDMHALSLMFSSIDKMAWLSSANINHGRKEFIAWVDNYFLHDNRTSLRAVDLYAARCGFLHTGTAESKLYRESSAKQIFYSTGPFRPQKEVEAEINPKLSKLGIDLHDVVVVQCIDLFGLWTTSMERFTDAINSDTALQTLTRKRAEIQLAIFPAG